jgi:hypothetical protein
MSSNKYWVKWGKIKRQQVSSVQMHRFHSMKTIGIAFYALMHIDAINNGRQAT